jgi:NADPH2:quinone reductase
VRIDASPINPSDQGLLFGGADLSTAKVSGPAASPVVTATVPPAALKAVAGRVDQSMPVGNEGAGVVVRAGTSAAAQALLGKTVAVMGGGMYTQYRCIKAVTCLVLPEGTTPAEGAAWFVNPLTALGMVATMRAEGHKALVHTAAASNLGQMTQQDLPQGQRGSRERRAQGRARCPPERDRRHPRLQLERPVLHGGPHRGARRDRRHRGLRRRRRREAGGPDPYRDGGRPESHGEGVQPLRLHHAQAGLHLRRPRPRADRVHPYLRPGLGPRGWLLTPFLQKIGFEAAQKLRERVAAEIKTTFASTYTKRVSLAEALKLEEIAVYSRQATGEKYLIEPNRGLR